MIWLFQINYKTLQIHITEFWSKINTLTKNRRKAIIKRSLKNNEPSKSIAKRNLFKINSKVQKPFYFGRSPITQLYSECNVEFSTRLSSLRFFCSYLRTAYMSHMRLLLNAIHIFWLDILVVVLILFLFFLLFVLFSS